MQRFYSKREKYKQFLKDTRTSICKTNNLKHKHKIRSLTIFITYSKVNKNHQSEKIKY